MKRTIAALMIALAVATPAYAEAPTYINTVTGLNIPVYPDWTQETLGNGIIQCTPAFEGGFFQIADAEMKEPIAEERRGFAYYSFEKQEDEDPAFNLLNVRNDELLGIDVAYTDMLVTYNSAMYVGRKMHFVNNGNVTIVTMMANPANQEQFTTEFENWIASYSLSE